MSNDSQAHLASSTPGEIAAATTVAIEQSRAAIDRVKRATGTAVEVLDDYDEALAALNGIFNLASLVAHSHPDAAMRSAGEDAMKSASVEVNGIGLDPAVYAALDALDVIGEDAPTRHFHARTLREFRRTGVDRDEATRGRARALMDEITEVSMTFSRNIQEDTRSGRFPVTALDGMPADYRRAHQPDADGMVTITTNYPDYQPFMAYATDAAAREEMCRLFRTRAYPANVEVLNHLLAKRHQLATLLGYPSWAAFVTEDRMIGTEQAAADFIERISEAAKPRADAEYQALLARKQRDEPGADTIHAWDFRFYQDRLKSETLAFDTRELRPYFEYTRVKAGLMTKIEQMFGISFQRVDDVPVWHPQVEVYDVVWTEGGAQLGRIFLDMHPRPNKFNHAAMFGMQAGKPSAGRLPECALMCNLPTPGDEPALLTHGDVTTFFHEFGHLIHWVIGGHQRFIGISGIATERDFVEAPSQLLEEWTFDAGTLAGFARHHETDEPLPAELVAKLRAADEFVKGLDVCQQMHYAMLSLELYRRDPAGLDPDEVNREAALRHTPFEPMEGTHWQLSFDHLTNYSAGYYTYMWSLVIAKDLFSRFAAEGLPAAAACVAYRDAVLAAGGSAPASELVKTFLGREYTFDAYQAWLDAA